jgi:hypothetical protein
VNGHVGANSVSEINASNGSFIRLINSREYKLSFPQEITTNGLHVWIQNDGNSTISELNSANGSFIRTINIKVGLPKFVRSPLVTSLVIRDTVLWTTERYINSLSGAQFNAVSAFDASNGKFIRALYEKRFGIDNPVGIAYNRDDVWVANGGSSGQVPSVSEFVAVEGTFIRRVYGQIFGFNGPAAIATNDSDVIVLNIDSGVRDSVTELNSSSGRLRLLIK